MHELKYDIELVNLLYTWLEILFDEESMEGDIENDVLTQWTGRDGEEYYWYLDCDGREGAINIKTKEIIDSDIIAEKFGPWC